MSILSFEYLCLCALSSILLWCFYGVRFRRYALLMANAAFLYLLKAEITDLGYLAAVFFLTWLGGYVLGKKKNPVTAGMFIVLPVLGLCYYKYGGYLTGKGLILPLGLSFYTFKAVSYLADVYSGKCAACSPVCVFDYICFFPAFSAGPIHRADAFFKELEAPFVFDYRDQKNGFIQAVLGLFEKLVIADALGAYASLFLSPDLHGWYTLAGVILYAFQIYTDFDAYSNTAIGTARMLGFHLERNFHTPYLSSGMKEFWSRWHISLSTWLRDYIYFPLGGSRKGKVRKYLNIMIVFLVSGMWHGSTVMFVIWGLGHGLLRILDDAVSGILGEKSRKILKPFGIIITFCLVSFLWIFFRSADMAEATGVISSLKMCMNTPLSSFRFETAGITYNEGLWIIVLLVIVFLSDLASYFTDMVEWLSRRNILVRWLFYAMIMVVAVIFGVYGPGYAPQDFIYVTF